MTAGIGLLPDCIEVIADKAAVFDLAEWAEGWAKAHGLDDDATFAMRLCVEEAVTNVVLYAYVEASRPGPLAVSARHDGDGVQVTITDQGAPFDVAAAVDSGRETDPESATIGGRGIRLMRQFSQDLHYMRLSGCNQLTLTFSAATTPLKR